MDDATRIEILPAARLGALSVAYCHPLQLLRAVIIDIAYLAVLVYLYAVVKHRSLYLPIFTTRTTIPSGRDGIVVSLL